MTKKKLTQALVRELTRYDPITGEIEYLVGRNKGKLAKKSGQYVGVYVNGHELRGHRWAFLYMTGAIPDIVDHKDRNKLNNAWENIRESTHEENNANNDAQNRSSTGVRGLRYDSKADRWMGQVTYNNTVHTLRRACKTIVMDWLAVHHRKQELWNRRG